MLDSVDRVEVVDRYTVKFVLKEPYVWLVNTLAFPWSTWIIAPEVVQQFGDLKKADTAIGTGPFILERYEPNVKSIFKRNPDYFRQDQPYVDGVEWTVLDDESTGLALYRTGQLDCGPGSNWSVRQQDLEALKKSHPHLVYQDFLSQTTHAIMMRTDMAPFTDVRVRRAISHAIDRQALIEAVWGRGAPTAAVSRGLVEWSLPVDQLGEGARYYEYDPKEARRLLAEAGFPKGFKTQLTASTGYGRDLVDDTQLVQRFLKEVGIEAELKLQEYGAYRPPRCRASSKAWYGAPSALPGNRTAHCIAPMRPTPRGTPATSMTPSSRLCSRNNGARKIWRRARRSSLISSAMWRSSSTMCT